MIRAGAGLGGDRGNEYQMPCAAAGYRLRKRGRRAMIDAIIKVVAGMFMRDARKVNNGIAVFKNGLPVEYHRQIGKRNGGDVRVVESCHPRRSDHLVPI